MKLREFQPLIGVTCGVITMGGMTSRAAGGMRYAEAIQAAGGLPVFVPPLMPSVLGSLLARLDGLLLTGGGDIDPMVYGEKAVRQVSHVEPARDETELALARDAMRSGLPVLGICRGLQVINVAAGGTLIQDLPSQKRSDVRHNQLAARHQGTHSVRLEPGSALAAISGEPELAVNSFHHQAIRELGQGLKVNAWAPDGVVEGIEGDGRSFILAVQWHPEEMWDQHPPSQRLFERLVHEARKRAGFVKRPSTPSLQEPASHDANVAGASFRLR